MTFLVAAAVKNGMADAFETGVGASPTIKLRTGAPPATLATADSGTVLATIPCPSNWLSDAVDGLKTILGTWQDTQADAAGTVGHFRLYNSSGTAVGQGTVTISGGGGDMTIDNPVLALNQQVTITAFSIQVA